MWRSPRVGGLSEWFVLCVLILAFTGVKCATVIKSNSGTVTSPNYPNPYPRTSNSDYVWRLQVPTGYIIKVTFNSMQLSGNDEVLVYDGWYCASLAWNHNIRKYKGVFQKSPVDVLFNTKNEMCIELERSKGNSDKMGFTLDFVAIPKCGGTLSAPSGDLVSEGYPIDKYSGKLKCEWTITVPEGQRIQITFQDFELQSTTNCEKGDVVSITENTASLLRACGNSKPAAMMSVSNTIKLKFKTNGGDEFKGFWLTYKATGCKKSAIPKLANGVLTNPKPTYEKSFIATYRCNTDFRFKTGKPEAISRCGEDNKWQPFTDTCVGIVCGDPGVPGNGRVTYSPAKEASGFTIGTIASYSCKPLYNLLGEPSLRCLNDGTWNSTRPICNVTGVRTCSDPGDPINGVKIGSNYSTGQSLAFKCNPGYTLQGSTPRTCQVDGSWTGLDVNCTVVICPHVYTPNDAVVSYEGMTYGRYVSYTCNQGFKLKGNATRTCEQSGAWSGSDPSCERIVCAEPNTLDHSTVKRTGLQFSSTATYECDPGFNLDGPKIRTCSNDGQWSGVAPFCAKNITNEFVNQTTSAEPITKPSTINPGTPKQPTSRISSQPTMSSVPVKQPSTILTTIVTPTDGSKGLNVKTKAPPKTMSTTIESVPNPDKLNSDQEDGGRSGMFIGIGVGAAVFVLLGLLCGFLIFRRKRSKNHAERGDGNLDKNFDNPMYGDINNGPTSEVSVNGLDGSASYRVPHQQTESGDIYAQSLKGRRPPSSEVYDNVMYADDVMQSKADPTVMLQNDLYESNS